LLRLVVVLNRRFCLAWMSFRRIRRATRFLLPNQQHRSF
jgi:hypothetical protein